MKTIYTFLFLLFVSLNISAQALQKDTRYLEDQFYIGISYNLLLNKPEDIEQRNLPYGLQLGYIKDIPLNKERNVGLGIGLGYAINNYYTNIIAFENAGSNISYTVPTNDIGLKRSKVATHTIEIPLELRWRNSTATEYKFWRVYFGAKLGWAFDARSKFVAEESKESFSNVDIRNLQYGLTLNFGYNTWNIHVYYQLNKLFNDNVYIGEEIQERINVKPLRIGVIFYIL